MCVHIHWHGIWDVTLAERVNFSTALLARSAYRPPNPQAFARDEAKKAVIAFNLGETA